MKLTGNFVPLQSIEVLHSVFRPSQKATCMYQLVLRGAGWVSEGVIVAMLLDIGLNWREMLLLLSPFVKKSH